MCGQMESGKKKGLFLMFLLQYLTESQITGFQWIHRKKKYIKKTGKSIYLYPRLQVLNPALVEMGAPFQITQPVTPDALNSVGSRLTLWNQWNCNRGSNAAHVGWLYWESCKTASTNCCVMLTPNKTHSTPCETHSAAQTCGNLQTNPWSTHC